MHDPIQSLCNRLASFSTHIEIWAERREDDGSIEINGLGQPALLPDDRCDDLIEALLRVDATLDADDLHDTVAQVIFDLLDSI